VTAIRFTPMPWQVPAWKDKSPVLLLTGSAGGGKSKLAAEKVHAYCLKYPGSCWLILRKAAEWTRKSIIPFYWQSVVAGTRGVTYSKSEGSFHYSNGSVVYSGGMADDKQRESIRSIGGAGGLDGAWMEEGNAFTRQDFEELRGRLRHTAASWRQLIITTNPGGSKHWINTDLIRGQQASVYKSGAKDNPHNPAEYVATLDSMTGMMRQRLALGLWVNQEGAVYDTFDSTPGGKHVHERPSSEFKRWFLAMDEGYTNPAVILLVGEDGDGRRHVAREYYQRGVLQSVVCAQALDWQRERGTEACIVDDSAAGLIAELRAVGVYARAARKGGVLDGIQLVQDALKVQGDGKARLTVDPACENLIGEFEAYRWKATNGIAKDEPVKENDHALDALRYLFGAMQSQEHFVAVV
jgi:phage terminase large subunit